MSQGRAASVSITIGAATATLVVAGIIVAWPALSACTGDAAGPGACLRDRLVERGLLVPGGAGETNPPLPVPRPALENWLTAAAAAAPPPAPGAVVLAAPGQGTVAGTGATVAPSFAPRVDLIPALRLEASIAAAPQFQAEVVRLSGQAGGISIRATAPPEAPVAQVALAMPRGVLEAEGREVPPRDVPVLNILDQIDRHLSAAAPEPEFVPMRPVVVEPLPAKPKAFAEPKPAPPSPEAAAPANDSAPPASAPVRPVYNPSFPNVVVLPAPNGGESSSIRTLTLD